MIFIITRLNGEVCEISCDTEKVLKLNLEKGDIARVADPETPVQHKPAAEVVEEEDAE